MRDIKFRAWDSDRNEYLSGGNVIIAIEAGRRPTKNVVYLDVLDLPDRYKDRFVIQQYIGLKDKNENEIYEGDILSGRLVVMWSERHASFVLSKDGWRFNHFFGESVAVCDGVADNVEIIGNIYENSDMLK